MATQEDQTRSSSDRLAKQYPTGASSSDRFLELQSVPFLGTKLHIKIGRFCPRNETDIIILKTRDFFLFMVLSSVFG